MERRINEPDWKILRELEPVARDRLCQRILSEVVRCATGTAAGAHDR